jgi:ATP-binding cassette subfamily B protein
MTPAATKPRDRARVVKGSITLLTTAFRVAPIRASIVFLLNIVEACSSALFPLVIKFLVDAATTGDVRKAVIAATVLGATWTLLLTAAITGFMLLQGLQERTAMRIDREIIDLTAGLHGVEHHERPEYIDQLQLLRDRRDQISNALRAVVRNVSFFMQIAFTFGLLANLHPLLVLLPLFGIPSMLGGMKMQRILIRADEKVSEKRRLANHFFDLATTAAPGKELRIFGIGRELQRRHDTILLENDQELTRARTKGTVWFAAGWFVFAIGYVLAILFVANRVLQGQGTLGDVVLAMLLASRVNENVSGGVNMAIWLVETMKTVARYLWLLDYAKEHRTGEPVGGDRIPTVIARGIDVDGVTFRYPGTEQAVLEDVSLHVPAGSTVAIVGDNGAGKSTLIKLLCRFYEPTEGRILLDGVDISTYDFDAWRARMSAGFQDFAKFELVAREVVGVGNLPHMEDEPFVHGALDRANATDVVETLARGFETQLGKSFDDGIELSGGQWQKLALGRAMMREEPLILVLDEPTAALDAQTEHALFERYAGAARAVAQRTGAITLFVSHRFSTVRMADLIIVVEGGRVREVGSHAELMRADGLYAELYELQAKAYR